MAASSKVGHAYTSPEHRELGSRLDARCLDALRDIAQGVEEGDAGLRSCAGVDRDVQAGVSVSDAKTVEATVAEQEDEEEARLLLVREYLDLGFSPAEIGRVLAQQSTGNTRVHLQAAERWCGRVRLGCDGGGERVPAPAPYPSRVWTTSTLHEDRARCRRALRAVRSGPDGHIHVGVLHVVYGHPDPLLLWATKFLRDQESAPAGEPLKVDPAERETFNLARTLLTLGYELAPLARYTAPVEARRLELVHLEAARRLRRVDGVIPLADHRERVAAADRCISSMDALRDGVALAPGKQKDESQDVYETRADASRTERVMFLSAIGVDANRMLTEASRALRAAWQWS